MKIFLDFRKRCDILKKEKHKKQNKLKKDFSSKIFKKLKNFNLSHLSDSFFFAYFFFKKYFYKISRNKFLQEFLVKVISAFPARSNP